MSDFANSLTMSASGLRAQAMRLRLTSENIANTDTPGYHRKMVPFETKTDPRTNVTTVSTGRVNLDRSDLQQIHDPSNPLADEAGNFDGSNVDIIIEIADAREAQRSYDANLKMFDQTRKMSASLLELLRR
ncbi:flagellar basal body rod protein FlgC [Puniceibacterium antarcticum]|uniref:Flagellar basal body rod protein FlgB n=1 Tax=Puniceibacterium antarcticum TaxID=1206336 RepID=A0A2G8RCX4_9RHOB|nr:flagellar basal body rod protein FlgC [Puniceibacterium antarcticum]PIL19271.1 flagellar basal body rod protein FlgC [Puniceibacterium antarcticum]